MTAYQRVLATYPVPSADGILGACARNVLAKLATVPLASPLLERVDAVIAIREERIYLRVETAFLSRLEGFSTGDDPVFAREGTPRSSVHADLLERIPHAGVTYRLVSFRERVTQDSLQCVVAVSSRPGFDYADCDIDLGGALTDVVGFVEHQIELRHGLTDHLAMRARFLDDATLGPLVRSDG